MIAFDTSQWYTITLYKLKMFMIWPNSPSSIWYLLEFVFRIFWSVVLKSYNLIIIIIIIIIINIIMDRLVGLGVSMSDYWWWGRGFDPRHFHKF